MSCQQVPTTPAFNPYPRSVQVGEFEVAIGGGIWVAIRGDIDVAHVRGQGQHSLVKVRSLLVPQDHPSHGEAMAQVMHPRSAMAAAIDPTQLLAQLTEHSMCAFH